jgi:hypothetical protein
VGRSVAGGEDKETAGLVVLETIVAEELGTIQPNVSKATGLQPVVHQLHELRNSGTMNYQNEDGGEEGRKGMMEPTKYILNTRSSLTKRRNKLVNADYYQESEADGRLKNRSACGHVSER